VRRVKQFAMMQRTHGTVTDTATESVGAAA
jgi:hypothetical protein